MRELRDTYFEANPNAPKNKYYLFLVNGFNDPTELGYMVRGRSMGFVKADPNNPTQVLQTISHELGHGIGALEHTWKNNGVAKGTTDNLMDYAPNARNLHLRKRFGIEEKNYSIASRIIAEGIKSGQIKDNDPESNSKKHAKYIPFWV